jgi:hypothetical protein
MARRHLTLLGTDVLLLAMGGRRPNNAVFVVECDGRLDPAQVSEALRRATDVAPWIAGRLERPFPWGRLRWTVDVPVAPDRRPIVSMRDGDDAGVVDEWLNTVVDPRRDPPFHVTVVAGEDAGRRPTTWLVLAWAHALMDPRGAELLVAMLDALVRGDDGRAWARERLVAPPEDTRPWRDRMAAARCGVEHLRRVTAVKPRSLARGVTSFGRVRHRRVAVPAPPPRQMPATLGHVGAAMAALWASRGLPPDEPFVVPISVDRRRKGEPGPVFGNYLSFHFARFPPAREDGPMTAAIRRDLAEAVRADAIDATWTAMNFARYYPPEALLRPVGGDDLASFNCADTGEVRPALPTLFGRPVRGAYHVPCVQPRPGLGVFLGRAAGVESVTAVWVEPVASDAEVDALLAQVARAIGAARAA